MKSAVAVKYTPTFDRDVHAVFESSPNEQQQLASRLPSVKSQPKLNLKY